MIVTFRGTIKSKNNAPEYLSACAVSSANNFSMKTVVLQFLNTHPIEQLLTGQKRETQGVFMATGMDEIFRRAMTQGLDKDKFKLALSPVFEQEGMLDIAAVHTNEDLYNTIIKNPQTLATIVDTAQAIYDNVFILLDGKNKEQIEVMDEVLKNKKHMTIVCIPQGNEQSIICDGDSNITYVISEYDRRSSFSVSYFKKKYKKVLPVPYNVSFKDACMKEMALTYCMNNSRVNEETDIKLELEDTNTNFITAIKTLTTEIVGIETDVKEKDLTIPRPKHYSFAIPNKKQLKAENVLVKERKKGKKVTKTVRIVDPEDVAAGLYDEPLTKKELKKQKKEEKRLAKMTVSDGETVLLTDEAEKPAKKNKKEKKGKSKAKKEYIPPDLDVLELSDDFSEAYENFEGNTDEAEEE